MTARTIGRSARVVVAAPAYLQRAGAPSTPAELERHTAVIYSQPGGRGSWVFRRGSEEAAVTLNGGISVTAAEGVREAVFAGMGFCVATEWMFQPELDDGRVRRVLPEWELPAMTLWAAFPAGRAISAKARAFAAFVEDQLRRTRFAP